MLPPLSGVHVGNWYPSCEPVPTGGEIVAACATPPFGGGTCGGLPRVRNGTPTNDNDCPLPGGVLLSSNRGNRGIRHPPFCHAHPTFQRGRVQRTWATPRFHVRLPFRHPLARVLVGRDKWHVPTRTPERGGEPVAVGGANAQPTVRMGNEKEEYGIPRPAFCVPRPAFCVPRRRVYHTISAPRQGEASPRRDARP